MKKLFLTLIAVLGCTAAFADTAFGFACLGKGFRQALFMGVSAGVLLKQNGVQGKDAVVCRTDKTGRPSEKGGTKRQFLAVSI